MTTLKTELWKPIALVIHLLFQQEHMKKFFKFCESRKMLWAACYKNDQIDLSGSDAKEKHLAPLFYVIFLKVP